jgi:hypothetical protein
MKNLIEKIMIWYLMHIPMDGFWGNSKMIHYHADPWMELPLERRLFAATNAIYQ